MTEHLSACAPWPNELAACPPGRRASDPLETTRTLLGMKRVLLTGMSGTGKSSVIRALSELGYKAIDTDDGWCEQLPDGRQRWREDAIAGLLPPEDADHEISTTLPLGDVLRAVLCCAGELRDATADHGKHRARG